MINIETQTIRIAQPDKVFTMSQLAESHRTMDNPSNKRLQIFISEANPPMVIEVADAEYDALGQWDDGKLQAFIIDKLKLVLKPVTITGGTPA